VTDKQDYAMETKTQLKKASSIFRNAIRHRLVPDIQDVEAISPDAWKNAVLAFAIQCAPVGEKNAPFFSRYRYRIQRVFGHRHYYKLVNQYQSSKSK
jgi:hypothetical protein